MTGAPPWLAPPWLAQSRLAPPWLAPPWLARPRTRLIPDNMVISTLGGRSSGSSRASN